MARVMQPTLSTDPDVWADEFAWELSRRGVPLFDTEWITDWFAKAIEAGRQDSDYQRATGPNHNGG